MSYDPIVQTSATLSNSESHFTFSGDIALCNLASINLMAWTKLSSPEEKYKFMYLLVRSADNAIDNSFYINPLGKKHSENHRNLGIGTSNYANFLASNRALWNSATARKLTHELYEELSFYAIKSSIQLAKEKSRCPVFNDTKWAQGLFPHELSKLGKSDSHLNYPLLMDWESLRPDLLKYGIRNSRLLAIAPTACQTKDGQIQTSEGIKSLELIMDEQHIDHKAIEESEEQGWFEFEKPIAIPTQNGTRYVNRIWYNGKQPTRTIEFEDGNSYTFTLNHKLMLTDGTWKEVGAITETDQIKQIVS